MKIVNPRTMYVWFPPMFSAPEHWHPYDTTYFDTSGSIRFGDEGWFSAGGLRWVGASHVYGPENAGPGVEFLLVSCGIAPPTAP